ncbi:hypothetical protein ABPG75_003161 [Micractinium tetrahymenae]
MAAPHPSRDTVSAAHIGCLPEQLLGHCFALAGRKEGRTITAVCRRWRDVFCSEPAFWRRLTLDAAQPLGLPAPTDRVEWWAGRLAALRRARRAVSKLSIRWPRPQGTDALALEATAAALQQASSRWAELSLQWEALLPQALAGQLSCFSALTSLRLAERPSIFEPPLLPPEAAQLTRLTGLCSLECYASMEGASWRHARLAGHLSLLTSLILEAARLPAGTATNLAASLARLPRLGSLRLAADEVPEAVVASVLQLEGLTRLELSARQQRRGRCSS